MLNSGAITKIQAVILIAVIVFVAIGGVVAYVILSEEDRSAGTIKIGLCIDLGTVLGDQIWQGAVLAAEEVNAEGGVLGRDCEIVVEDDDSGSGDMQFASSAFTKLITVDEVDFIVSMAGPGFSNVYQEKVADHQKILFYTGDTSDALTQNVLDDYDRYKYFFRVGLTLNTSANTELLVESIVVCREYTGFNKVAILANDFGIGDAVYSSYVARLEDYDFDVVYTTLIPFFTMDFSSYFAQAEAAGAEILYPIILGEAASIAFVKEYYGRQSPMVMWGLPGVRNDFWEITEGKCNSVACAGHSVTVGYPLTSKILPTREAYMERWGEGIVGGAAFSYDIVRFILPDAIERAGTIETDAVIEALEETEIETSLARKLAFTSSHDTLVTMNGEDYWVYVMFQWQDGEQVPVYPEEIMKDAGATYTYPDWDGPWSK